jgi:hypothetical protein
MARPHTLQETVVGTSRNVRMSFSSQAQYDDWLAKQRAAGNDWLVVSREEGTGYFSQPLTFQLKLGGPEGLRAIGYVALTFFAHHFPEQARQPGVLQFKKFVQGTSEGEFVRWDSPNATDGLPANPFAFGHTVALCVSAWRSAAYARVSLFSALNFVVHLGGVVAVADRTIIVHIDPQAEHPPDDIVVLSEDSLAFEINRPSSRTADLREMIESGHAQESLQILFNKIFVSQRDRAIIRLLYELNSVRELDADERNRKVQAIVNKEGQRVLNLMRHVVAGLRLQFEGNPVMVKLLPSLNALVAGDGTSLTRLSQTASDALGVAKAKLAEEIEKHLSNGDLDFDRLSMLLGGGPGAALVGRAILDPILARL